MIRCLNCDATDKWENVDEYRITKKGMCICTSCGFVSYPNKNEKLKDFYRNEYRGAPTVQNLFTGQRKLHFHAAFLSEVLDKWREEKKAPAVFEIGAAFGMVLNWFRDNFKEATVAGSELTLAHRRVAWNMWKIKLDEEFDASRKWDMIVSYKVAEHIPDIDKEIRRYVESLADGGYLYISVPTWFGAMTNFGMSGFDLEYYYHTNHINMWTEAMFENILARAGAKVIKKDNVMYDSTYLCVRDDSLMSTPVLKLDPTNIKETMGKIKTAYQLAIDRKWDEAIKVYPNFPDGIAAAYEAKRKQVHELGYEGILKECVDKYRDGCKNAVEIEFLALDIAMRYEQYEDGIGVAEKILKMKPQNPKALINLAHCLRQLAIRATNPETKNHFFRECLKVGEYLKAVSLQNRDEAINWCLQDYASIPLEGEHKNGVS